MKPRQNKKFIAAITLFLPLAAFVLYCLGLYGDRAYIGLKVIEVDLKLSIIYCIWIGTIICLYPKTVKFPSDIFASMYLSITCLYGATLWQATELLTTTNALQLLFFLVSPVIALKFSKKIPFPSYLVPSVQLLSERFLPIALLIILVAAGITGYSVSGHAGGFEFSSSYDRRTLARHEFGTNMVARYLFQMAENGAAPFLAFVSSQTRLRRYLFCSLAFAVFCYWLIGTKASFAYIAAMYCLGILCRLEKYESIPSYSLLAQASLFTISFIEYFLTNYSQLADYFIRRLVLVPTQIQTYYWDALINTSEPITQLLSGIDLGQQPRPSFYIGEKYFNNPLTNANTNAFLYSISLAGLPGLVFCIGIVCTLFIMLDKYYSRSGNKNLMAITSLYSLLLLEQAFSTALISSGILLCLGLAIVFSRRSGQP